MIDCSLPLNQAMLKPRMHCTIGGKLTLETEGIDSRVIEHLSQMGYKMDLRDDYAFYFGAIQAVMKLQKLEGFQGVAEVRRDGKAEGI